MSIKKGDLVAVVQSAKCGCCSAVGLIRTVSHVGEGGLGTCARCGKTKPLDAWAELTGDAPWKKWRIEISRLKKIDPPSTGELDRVPRRLKEPA